MNSMDPFSQHQRAQHAAMPQIDWNNSGDLWDIDLPETVADCVDDINISKLVEELPPMDPTAVDTVQPCDLASLGRSSSTSRSSRSVRRTLTDAEVRKRAAERQRAYRERRRNKTADLKKSIDVTATEIEAELVQQDSLLVERTVLTKASEYCVSSITAVSSLVSNAMERMRSEYYQAVNGLGWMLRIIQGYSPTDAQMHAYLGSLKLDGLVEVAERMAKKCNGLFNKWIDEPESRATIEAQLERLRVMRVRSLKYFVENRPEVTLALYSRTTMPTLPDGAPNPKLVEAVAALELTPEQLESLEREWILHLQKTESIRQEARSTLNFFATSGADKSAAAYCSIGASELFLDRLQAVQELETHLYSEASTIVSFNIQIATVFTIPQKALLNKHCSPYFPEAVQIARIVFGDNFGNAGSASKVQIVNIETDT